MPTKKTILALALRVLLFVASLALAGSAYGSVTLYNNLGPGLGYDAFLSRPIGGINFFADAFTSSATATLMSLMLPLQQCHCSNQPDTSGNIVVSLQTNNKFVGADIPSGTILESFTIDSTQLPQVLTSTLPWTLNSILHPTLTAGTLYWIEVAPTSTSNFVEWNFASPGVLGESYQSGVGFSTGEVLSGLNVTGDTPEPESLSLVAFGAILLGAYRTNKRRRSSAC